MKKYKIIKEYPGGPKLGSIATPKIEGRENQFFTHKIFSPIGIFFSEINEETLIRFNDHWEEVIEKEYEILSFICVSKNTNNTVSTKLENGNHKWLSDTYPDENQISEDKLLNNKNYAIHSIKRLSDGEIFTIGDYIQINSSTNPCSEQGNIVDFSFIPDISKISKIKPLFTTEDGVDIYKNDKFVAIHTTSENFNIFNCTTECRIVTKKISGWKYFSTKEKAEEYIIMNKPCLSINEILQIKKTAKVWENKFKELVKEKLKLKIV